MELAAEIAKGGTSTAGSAFLARPSPIEGTTANDRVFDGYFLLTHVAFQSWTAETKTGRLMPASQNWHAAPNSCTKGGTTALLITACIPQRFAHPAGNYLDSQIVRAAQPGTRRAAPPVSRRGQSNNYARQDYHGAAGGSIALTADSRHFSQTVSQHSGSSS